MMNENVVIERSVGDIHLEVTVEEAHDDTLVVTEHAVEQGVAVSDHAYKNPMKVDITAGTSANEGEGVPRETYEKLLELQASLEPFTIVTGKRTYANMLVEGINVTTNADTENILMATLSCREVILVSTQTVQVPPAQQAKRTKTQKTQKTGTKHTTDATPPNTSKTKK